MLLLIIAGLIALIIAVIFIEFNSKTLTDEQILKKINKKKWSWRL